MEPKWGLVGPTFQEKCENEKVRLDCAGAYGLHMSPSLKAPVAAKKIHKKQMCFKYAIVSSKIRKCLKNDLPNVTKWVSKIWGWRLLAPLAPLFETCTQTCSKSGPKIAKMPPKGLPKLTKGVPSTGEF